MDHLSKPVDCSCGNQPHNYPGVGPKYGDGQSGANGDVDSPVAEGQIAFANGPEVAKTLIAPKAGAPGPM